LAVASFILSIFSLVSFLLAAVPSIALAIIAIVKIGKSHGQLKGRALAVAALVISVLVTLIVFGAFALWSLDADPLPSQYTIDDLRSAAPEYAETYHLLKALADPQDQNVSSRSAIGLSEQHIESLRKLHRIISRQDYSTTTDALRKDADAINQIWQSAQKGRDVIDKLSRSRQIADPVTPDMNLPDERLFTRNLFCLSYLYQAYVLLLTDQANDQRAVEELTKFDSVLRKLSVNARDFFLKMFCLVLLEEDIKTAAFLVNHPRTSNESLNLLKQHFAPLTDEQLALRTPILFKSLEIDKLLTTQVFADPRHQRNKIGWKPNSTFRLYRNFWIRQLEIVTELKPGEGPLSVWPRLYPHSLPHSIGSNVTNIPLSYRLYNAGGATLFRVSTPSFAKQYEHKPRMRALDDLFQLLLNRRLGTQATLSTRGYGGRYIVDSQNRRVLCPGPDGKVDTDDDVTLPMNPELLDWKK
jgi:hypothetical protein